jgi:hypothetical protein
MIGIRERLDNPAGEPVQFIEYVQSVLNEMGKDEEDDGLTLYMLPETRLRFLRAMRICNGRFHFRVACPARPTDIGMGVGVRR